MPLHTDLQFTHLISCYFEKFTKKGDYLFNVRCPLCGDSHSKKTKMRGYIYRNKQRLAYKCHNCNVSIWLGALIKQLAPQLYKEYLLETFTEKKTWKETSAPVMKATASMRMGTVDPVIYQHAEKISDLPEQHYCREYVKSRGIPEQYWNKLYFAPHYLDFLDEIVPGHEKKIKDDARLVIPFYDAYGAVLAVSGRALDDSPVRYITVRTTADNTKLVYGLERVDQSKPVYITEGPLDSLFLDNAVASGDANLILTAKQLSAGQIILVFDNESRSPEIIRQMERAIKEGYAIVIWPEWVKEKDINKMSEAGRRPKEIIYSHTFKGLTALTHLAHWKKTSNNKGVLV